MEYNFTGKQILVNALNSYAVFISVDDMNRPVDADSQIPVVRKCLDYLVDAPDKPDKEWVLRNSKIILKALECHMCELGKIIGDETNSVSTRDEASAEWDIDHRIAGILRDKLGLSVS